MRRKDIEKRLKATHNSFCKSITDETVRELVKQNSIITGGCITSMLLNEDVNDYDIYFTNKETVLSVANYYNDTYNKNLTSEIDVIDCSNVHPDIDISHLNGIFDDSRVYMLIGSSGVALYVKTDDDLKNGTKYLPIVFSCNAITLHDDIQLITRFYGDADKIHENFDFEHAKCYWESSSGKVTLPTLSLECILNKQLIYGGSKYPLSSIIRTRKFIKRSWNITGGEYLKMSFQVSKLDLTDVNVLSDQLAGVDTTYFLQIIHEIEQRQSSGESFSIDSTYIGELVDKYFN